ncbi:MAG: alpha/beta hydrolase [Actinobacteria bacterium]|nr:alpha/beta hydrolase [Thermoleophilia bacterium]MCB9011582.1 alpha/beta hydrolase [Actinomycetota bacterium]
MAVPTPILLHGEIGGPACWGAIDGRFAGVASIRLPGHPDGDATADLEVSVGRVARTVARLDPPRVLIGHGVGGALAIEVALQDPDLLAGIVTFGVGTELPVDDGSLMAAFTDHAAEAHRLLAESVHHHDTPEALRIAGLMEQAGARTLAADYQLCRQVQLVDRTTELRIPVLVVAGADDVWAPPEVVELLARQIPTATMVVVPGARHLAMVDRPDACSQLIAAFLARIELSAEDVL